MVDDGKDFKETSQISKRKPTFKAVNELRQKWALNAFRHQINNTYFINQTKNLINEILFSYNILLSF